MIFLHKADIVFFLGSQHVLVTTDLSECFRSELSVKLLGMIGEQYWTAGGNWSMARNVFMISASYSVSQHSEQEAIMVKRSDWS